MDWKWQKRLGKNIIMKILERLYRSGKNLKMTPKDQPIYVVTQGEYSHYRIVGVFTDKALAEKCVDMMVDTSVEVFIPNQHRTELEAGLMLYDIGITRDGDVNTDLSDAGFYIRERSLEWVMYGMLWLNIWARDIDHAAKIANEKRISLIAQNLWAPDHFPNEIITLPQLQDRLAKQKNSKETKNDKS